MSRDSSTWLKCSRSTSIKSNATGVGRESGTSPCSFLRSRCPRAGVQGEYVHGTLFEIAAAYLFHIAKNHPFVDGNKRTALAAAVTFLDLNRVAIEAKAEHLVILVGSVILGSYDKSHVAVWLRDHAAT